MPDPSVFNDLENEVSTSHLTGSYERLDGDVGGPFTLHFLMDFFGGIIFDAGVVQFVGADHAVKAHGCPERAFLGRIGED